MTQTEVLTFPQRRAFGELLRATTGRTAKSIYTRSDVLWRLEGRGYVTQSINGEWRITTKGEHIYERASEALSESAKPFGDVRLAVGS